MVVVGGGAACCSKTSVRLCRKTFDNQKNNFIGKNEKQVINHKNTSSEITNTSRT